MIHYDLLCAEDHRFDGWFKDSAAFEVQATRGLLECPVCGGVVVTRALMAPAVKRKGASSTRRPAEQSPPVDAAAPVPANAPVAADAPPGAVASMNMPAHMRALLQRMRSEVERRCDYVGTTFADEARRMHRGDIDARSIYGETTPEQAQSLQDEGIEVAVIPWIPRADG